MPARELLSIVQVSISGRANHCQTWDLGPLFELYFKRPMDSTKALSENEADLMGGRGERSKKIQ